MSDLVEWAYIGRLRAASTKWPASTAVAAMADDPRYPKDTAKEVAAWIRKGLTIERVPVAWVRQYLFTAEPYRPNPGEPRG